MISLEYHETLCVGAGKRAEAHKHKIMEEQHGKYVLITEGATPPRTAASTARSADKPQMRAHPRGRRRGRRHHRHRLLRLLGRYSVGGAQSHRGGTHPRDHPGQDGHQHPGLSAQPLQLPLHRALPADLRQAAGAGPAQSAKVRLRASDPRELRAASPLRRRPLSRWSSATTGIARASVSTSSAARDPRPMPIARPSASATRERATGPSASAIPASAAP